MHRMIVMLAICILFNKVHVAFHFNFAQFMQQNQVLCLVLYVSFHC